MSAVSLSRKVVALTTTLATIGTALALLNPPRHEPKSAESSLAPAANVAQSDEADNDELPTWSHFERYRPQALPEPGGLERWIGAAAGSRAHSADGHHNEGTAANRAKPFDLSTLRIAGATSFDPQEIRNALEWDFDLQLALIFDALESETSGVLTERRTLNCIEGALESGYRRAGFGNVRVDVHVDEAARQIVGRVSEGECYRCAGVKIAGMRQVSREALLAGLLKSPRRSWVLWTSGEPVPFDQPALAELRRQVAAVYAAYGYRSPVLNVEIVQNNAERSAMLLVKIDDEGPRTLIGRIDVIGTERDSVEEVLNYLELRPGMPFDESLPDRLKWKLWESGRYWTFSVKTRMPPAGEWNEGDGAFEISAANRACSLQIELEEYGAAPPLRDAPSPAEQALLKLNDWLKQWARGEVEDEIVLSAALGPQMVNALGTAILMEMGMPMMLIGEEWFDETARAEPQSLEPKVSLRAVLAPRRGQVFAGQVTNCEGRTLADVCLAVQADSLVLASRRRRTKIELRNDAVWQPQIKFVPYPPRDKDVQGQALHLDLELTSRSRDEPSTMLIDGLISTTAAAALARDKGGEQTIEEGIWTFRGKNYELRFEDGTGRLLELSCASSTNGTFLNCRTAPGALTSELQSVSELLEGAIVQPATDAKALLRFATDELLGDGTGSAGQRARSLAAMHKILECWSPPPLENVLGPAAEAKFHIPGPWACGMKNASLRGLVSEEEWENHCYLPILARVFPRKALVLLAGDRLWHSAATRGDSASKLVRQITEDQADWLKLGTLGKFVVTLHRWWKPAQPLSREQLAALRFADDYQPFLANDSWLGASLVSLIEALRSLDPAELRQLAMLFPETAREPAEKALLLIRRDPEEGTVTAASAALDSLWNDLLRAPVEEELTALSERLGRYHAEKPRPAGRVQPASGQSAAAPVQ